MANRIHIQKGVSIYTRDDAQGYYADISRHGERIKRPLGDLDGKDAAKAAIKIYNELQPKVSGADLSAVLVAWLKDRERAPQEKSALREFLRLYPNRRLDQVDNATVSLALGEKSAGTYNRTVNILRAALNLAKVNGLIEATPTLRKKKEPPGRDRWLKPEEYERLIAELPPHIVAPFEFALCTGQRKSNVLNLKWDQIQNGMMIIKATEYKQRRGHAIPLGAHALAILKALEGNNSEYVFLYKGKPIKSPQTTFEKAKKRAGIEDFRWHDLRHTYASWMLLAGAPLTAVKQGGGWASMVSVARYAHLENKQLAQYADAGVDLMKSNKAKAEKETVPVLKPERSII